MSNLSLQTKVIQCFSNDSFEVETDLKMNEMGYSIVLCPKPGHLTDDEMHSLRAYKILHEDTGMNKAAIGHHLGHYRALKEFLEGDAKLLLVLESDVHLKPNFKENLSNVLGQIEDLNKPWNALYLYHSNFLPYDDHVPAHDRDKLRLLRLNGKTIPTSSAYILTRDYARHLSKVILPMRHHYHNFMANEHFAGGHESYTLPMENDAFSKEGRGSELVWVPGLNLSESDRNKIEQFNQSPLKTHSPPSL